MTIHSRKVEKRDFRQPVNRTGTPFLHIAVSNGPHIKTSRVGEGCPSLKHSQFSEAELSPPPEPLQNLMVMTKSLVKDSAEVVLIESCKP